MITMAKQIYGFRNLSSGSSLNGAAQSLPAAFSSLQEEALNRYLPTSVAPADLSAASLAGASDDPEYYSYSYNPSWPSSSPIFEPLTAPPTKRSSRELYHPTMYGGHNTHGQTEGWYSNDALSKRPRTTIASDILNYPQRPGEKDCAHYMLTRTCKFGDGCKFNHPVWVPEGGIPDWKEVPNGSSYDTLPERPGLQDCPFYLKTQTCKYGSRCKFNHPNEITSNTSYMTSLLPERPSEPLCAFYMKSGKCKFGATCKFHHPKDVQISPEQQSVQGVNDIKGSELLMSHCQNFKGLPLRPGEVDCPFYMKTGSCKYGPSCRYNHPERNGSNTPNLSLDYSSLSSFPINYNARVTDPLASLYQVVDSVISRSLAGNLPSTYPQRPGQIECDYYMKTGECKFAERCRFHHPIDRFAPLAKETQLSNVKLTLAGLPRREGAARCPFYMKTGACKYGANCKFDHPPPGEVISQQVSSADTVPAEPAEDEG